MPLGRKSAVIGGRSTIWIWTSSSKTIMPGTGPCVAKGKGVGAVGALERRCTMALFPAFGAPRSGTCPAPHFSMRKGSKAFFPFEGLEASSRSLEILRRRSACRWSVPLCLGMTASISSRAAIFSSVVFADL
jgi:hypothetical protein